MPVIEIAVWSAMLGGLLTLTGVALSDALINRTRAATRNLVFLLAAGSSCVVMSGLLETLWPVLDGRLLMVLKAGLGPLAGAMALYYLGNWLGGAREDARVHQLTAWGGAAVGVAALVLAALATQVDPARFRGLLIAAGVVNIVPVLLAVVAVKRAAHHGDPLAHRMLVAVASLLLMVCGLYLKGLQVEGVPLLAWVLTAVLVMTYFLMSTALVRLRNQQLRRLARLSRLDTGTEPATGLATGATLLSQMEHVFWRTARQQGECTVVCLYLSNLYELNDSAGVGVEHQILQTMAARVRRAAGFRGLVGLYHPRCFAVLISTDQYNAPLDETLDHLRRKTVKPLSVTASRDAYQTFTPRIGLGVVSVDPSQTLPMDALNEAERRALASVSEPDTPDPQGVPTQPMPLA